MIDSTLFASFEVHSCSDIKQVEVLGRSLGDLRMCIRSVFGIPAFEQKIVYDCGGDKLVDLEGDDTVLLTEKPGLLGTKKSCMSLGRLIHVTKWKRKQLFLRLWSIVVLKK